MKKLLTSALVLGSTVAVAACSGTGYSASDLDGSLLQPPYAEERTVGAQPGNVAVRSTATTAAPRVAKVKSAAPVFARSQVK